VAFEAFKGAYNAPQPGTAAMDDDLSPGLRHLADEGLAGIYGDGVLSLLSRREYRVKLGPWSVYLPGGAQVFGTTGFGSVFVTAGDEIFLVDPQYGQVVTSAYDLEGFLERVAEPGTREEIFREALFRLWVEVTGPLAATDVLSPTPALPLGGDWTLASLRPASLEVYLALTGQLFGPGTGLDVEFR
jgi:hypothetical protein